MNKQLTTDHENNPYYGVLDVSGWQMNYKGNGALNPGFQLPDLTKAAALGVAGIFARIANGTSIDESCVHFHKAAHEAGLHFGIYYYAQPRRMTALASAHQVKDLIDSQNLDLSLPIMLDFEEYYGSLMNPAETSAWISEFLRKTKHLTGIQTILYAGHAFLNPSTCKPLQVVTNTIQPRYYKPGTPPANVKGWGSWIRWDRQPTQNTVLKAWDGWQFSADGNNAAHTYGMPSDSGSKSIDLNVVHKDVYDMWTVGATPAPEPGELLTPSYGPFHASPDRVLDTRENGNKMPTKGDKLVIVTLPGVAGCELSITTIGGTGTGYITSNGITVALIDPNVRMVNTTTIPVRPDGTIKLTLTHPCHLVIDRVSHAMHADDLL